FSRKWQLSAYFSIQKKHVIAVLEDFERGKPLDAARGSESNGTRPSTPAPKPQVEQDVLQIKHREGLLTEHAARAVWAIQQCWTSNVYLEALAAKFWQLTMQILLWYQQTASQCVQQLIQSNASKSSVQALESHELDELLHHMHDMFAMREVAMEQTRAICRVVPGTDNGSCGISAGLESAVGQALAPLDDTSNKAADHISSTITVPSTTTLASHLRRTTSQFRHTNRPSPSTPSPYISSLFAYLESTESKITHDQATSERIKHMLRSRVATRVSQEFARVCADALATISKTEASLLRLRKSRGSNVRVDVGDVVVPSGVDLRGKVPEADNDKIRRQIWLDVDQVARIVRGYGVETDPEFARFVDLIQPFGI
ncbi:Conserved oligomeric Golgi complex subunit 2, partial [Coemansia sp. RSA 1824]